MRGLPHTWERSSDPAEREALANDAMEQAALLSQSPAWQEMTEALRLELTDTLNDLARSSKEDEQKRGVIRALNHVLEMPENLIRAASSELDKYR